MRLKVLIATAGAILVLGTAAFAAPPPPAQPSALAQNEALVRRYLAAIHFEKTMDTMQAAMLRTMAEQTARAHPELSAEDRAMIADIVRKVMREKMTPQLIERFVPAYASTFTTAELQALVDFYESPLGRSITAKTPSLAPKGAEIMRDLMPSMIQEVLKEIIARKCPGGTCSETKLPKPAAS